MSNRKTNYTFGIAPTADVSIGIAQCGTLPVPVAGQCQYNDTGAKCDAMSGLQIGFNRAYDTSDNYTAKVIVERGDASSQEKRVSISSGKIDIKAQASDGPVTIDADTSTNLSWTSENVTSCAASGTGPNWSDQTGSGATLYGRCPSRATTATLQPAPPTILPYPITWI